MGGGWCEERGGEGGWYRLRGMESVVIVGVWKCALKETSYSHSHSQIKSGVRTATAWVTASQTAPNWPPSRTDRQQALVARTTSRPPPQTTSTHTSPPHCTPTACSYTGHIQLLGSPAPAARSSQWAASLTDYLAAINTSGITHQHMLCGVRKNL